MAGQNGQAVAFDIETSRPIPEEDAPRAIAEGRASFRTDAEVHLRDPKTGEAFAFPADLADKALADGYVFIPAQEVAAKLQEQANREKYGGVLQTAGTVAEGAADAVTFGVYSQAATDLGLDTARRAEANPGARAFGEVAGTVGSLFIPGGAVAKGVGAAGKAGQAARLATAAPRALARGAEALGAGVTRRLGGGLGARALGAGVAGATEGAAYGAGQVVSRAALQDQELTAEMLLGGATEGATLGGLLGGGIGAAGGLLGKTGGAVSKRLGGPGKLDDFANREAALAMLGGDKKALNKALTQGGMKRLERIGERVRKDWDLAGNPEKAMAVVNREAVDSVERLKSVASKLDEAGARIERAGLVSKIDDQIASAGAGLTGSARGVGKGLIKELKPLRERLAAKDLGELTFQETWDFRRALDDVIYKEKDSLGSQTMLGKAVKETRDDLSKSLDDAAEGLSPELKATWKKANADYSDMSIIRTAMENRVKKDLGKSLVSSGDTLSAAAGIASGLATGSTLMGMGTGLALGAANRLIKDRGHEFLARAADRLTRTTSTMDGAARSLAGQGLSKVKRAVTPVAISLSERYEQRRQEVLAAQSPQAMTARLAKATQGLEHERGLVTAIHAGMKADTAYLQQAMPTEQTRSPGNTLTQAPEAKPSRTAMSQFVSKAEALADPAGVMADVANGQVDLAAIDALKARRPKIYAEMRKKIIAYAAQRGEALPYKQRVTLSLAFDFTADPSMEPATMATIQGAFVPAQTDQPGAAGAQETSSGPQRKLSTDTTADQLPGETAAL